MNTKSTLLALGLAVIIVVGFWFTWGQGTVLAEDISLVVFEHNAERTGVAAVRVPFARTADPSELTIAVDGQIVAENVPALPAKDWSRTYSFAWAGQQRRENHTVRVTMGDEAVEKTVAPEVRDAGSLLDLVSVTDPVNATKGIGNIAYAQEEEVIEITQDGVPDLPQKPGECGPTVAANGLISLIQRHGDDEQKQKTQNPQELIDQLKSDMNWTRENGTPPDQIVSGKNAWAARNGLPIRTEKLGDANGLTSLEAIQNALQSGAAVELRIAFADANGRPAGGHVVSVTGFHQGFGQTYLDVNDPVSPEGTDTYEVRGNVFSNYGYFNGHTVLSWVIVQRWGMNPLDQSSGTTGDTSEQSTQGVPVEVIDYNGKLIPVVQLRVGEAHPPHEAGEGCPERHWHADTPVTALDGAILIDPNPGGCGFGTLSGRPVITTTAPGGQPTIEVRGLEGLR